MNKRLLYLTYMVGMVFSIVLSIFINNTFYNGWIASVQTFFGWIVILFLVPMAISISAFLTNTTIRKKREGNNKIFYAQIFLALYTVMKILIFILFPYVLLGTTFDAFLIMFWIVFSIDILLAFIFIVFHLFAHAKSEI